MSKQIIQNQVDLMVFEEGRFSVINWLLREGYLDYMDYQKWRNGDAGYLEDHFTATTAVLIADLEIAQRYANKLKLESFHVLYSSVDNQRLHLCRSPAHELIFTTDYEPAQDRLQMDLFFDSAPACTANDLIRAVIERREDDILRLLSQLQSLDPEKQQKFERLLTLQNVLSVSGEDSGTKINLLLQALTPLAFNVLDRFAQDFLTPLWHLLSVEITDRYFDAESPENHLSFTAFKGFQWQQALSSIAREANWINQPVLLFRYGEACFKLNKELEGLEIWFRLFLTFPVEAETMIGNTCNRLLLLDWRCFSELDPELESSFFPAWIVLKKPALAKNAFSFDHNSPGNSALQLMCSLMGSKEKGLNESTIKLRARLQMENPNLFIHTMAANP